MEIHYLKTSCCQGEIFSFNIHDYRKCSCGKSFIDGGFDDYIRCGEGEVLRKDIKDIISVIREQFIWGQVYDKNGNRLENTLYKKLKDLDSDHILGILSYFNNRAYKGIVEMQELENYPVTDKSYHMTHEIFIQELIYRNGNK